MFVSKILQLKPFCVNTFSDQKMSKYLIESRSRVWQIIKKCFSLQHNVFECNFDPDLRKILHNNPSLQYSNLFVTSPDLGNKLFIFWWRRWRLTSVSAHAGQLAAACDTGWWTAMSSSESIMCTMTLTQFSNEKYVTVPPFSKLF